MCLHTGDLYLAVCIALVILRHEFVRYVLCMVSD